MGKKSRTKGATFERATAKTLRGHGLDAERKIQQSRVIDDADVELIVRPTTVMQDTVVLLECKNYKRPTWGLVSSALTQCAGYVTDDNELPCAIIHLPGTSKDVVFMDWEIFVRLIGGVVANESGDSQRAAA